MMTNLSIINILPNRLADIYIELKSITSKFHNTSASNAFIKKASFVDVIPKFAVVQVLPYKYFDTKNSLQEKT